MGDSITEGTVFELQKNVGDYVAVDDIVAIIETDKIKVDIRSPDAGVITQLHSQLEDTVEVGNPFYELDTSAAQPEGQATQKVEATETKTEAPKTEAPKQQQPQQTQQQEVKKEAPKQPVQQQQTSASTPSHQPFTRNEKREKMSRMRLKIAERLKAAQNTYALLTTFQEVDMSAVMDMRKQLQDDFTKKHGVKLGFMSFFIKGTVMGLQQQPIINAVIDGNEIVYRDYIDISVAVSTPSGLLVPVLRNCESQNFAQIEKNLIELADKGKNGQITAEDMAGGTFTVSNGGVFGSLLSTPILNPPQSAILGMHAIVNRPVVRGDQIVARPMMYLALTYDHRIVDGKEAATFLKKLQTNLEDPKRMLLDL